jgi:exonuclease SbcD
VRPVPLAAGRRLRTIRGTLDQVLAAVPAEPPDEAAAGPTSGADGDRDGPPAGSGPPHLRIVLDEPARAGLADEVRERLPDAVEVVLASREVDRGERRADPDRLQRTPHDLFTEYLGEQDVDDDRLVALFDDLVDEAVAEPAGERT